jgi:aldose 1-epimerase
MPSPLRALLLAATVATAQQAYQGFGGATTPPFPPFSGDPFQKYSLSAKGINASFIPYGARLTSLCVNDKNGTPQDVAVGYDEGSRYLEDTETNHTYVLQTPTAPETSFTDLAAHRYFGAVVGRYANR